MAGDMKSMVFKLADCGLSANQIEKALRQMIGSDWKEVDVDVWLSRLKAHGHVLQDDRELTLNDLEALVKGRIVLEDLAKRNR